MIGVVYKFNPHNKLNGSLFYCYEYAAYLNAPLYLVDISDRDMDLILKVFSEKYSVPVTLTPVTTTQLHSIALKTTLILDIRTFYDCKEFLTNDIHVFSNVAHKKFRYKNERTVTYYGSYDYQDYDVFCYSKMNFEIFKRIDMNNTGVFVSGLSLKDDYEYPGTHTNVITKKHDRGVGNVLGLVDTVHYVHNELDTSNRIIPEAFYYDKQITIDDNRPELIDSVTLRHNDILKNGLINYTITTTDKMVKACQAYNN